MTEAEWLACADPVFAIQFLGEKAASRKLRLYFCACGRQLWPLLSDKRSRRAVEVGEEIADQPIGTLELMKIRDASIQAAVDLRSRGPLRDYHAAEAVQVCVWGCVFAELACSAVRSVRYAERLQGRTSAGEPDPAWLVGYLSCIFGNPFRPVTFSPSWRTDTAMSLARQMYESREFSAMPILADALQDAGCDNDDILAHCRDASATHVRGCWVVDLVLDKS